MQAVSGCLGRWDWSDLTLRYQISQKSIRHPSSVRGGRLKCSVSWAVAMCQIHVDSKPMSVCALCLHNYCTLATRAPHGQIRWPGTMRLLTNTRHQTILRHKLNSLLAKRFCCCCLSQRWSLSVSNISLVFQIKQRIIDVDTKNSIGLLGHIEELSHNALAVYWNPLESPAKVNLAIQCLSTDFRSAS